ncbi:hypothetical protein ACHAWF_014466 [Thalassiosira exigua]
MSPLNKAGKNVGNLFNPPVCAKQQPNQLNQPSLATSNNEELEPDLPLRRQRRPAGGERAPLLSPLIWTTDSIMPAPVTIRDPAAYAKKGPSAALGEDPNPNPIVPLRNFVSTGLPMRPLAASSDSSIDDDRATCSRPRRATLITQMNDTSMSPRLLGYVFSCISSTVSMISSAVFFAREGTLADPESIRKYSESTGNIIPVEQLQTVSQRVNMMSEAHTLYFGSGGNLTEAWKVYGCIAVSISRYH